MRKIKNFIRNIIGENYFLKLSLIKQNIQNYTSLIDNQIKDFKLYCKHSLVFKLDTFNKIEAKIILRYHSIEKGLLHNEIRYKYGRQNIIELRRLLKIEEVIANRQLTQIAAAYLVLCEYYEMHLKYNIDISDYYPKIDYDLFKSYSSLNFHSVIDESSETYFKNSNKNFYDFSNSRHSVRDFTGEKIPFETIEKVIEIAKNVPSVCNRQPVRVYYLENKNKIDEIFSIQRGLTGYSDNIKQLLVVVCDRNYFYSIGERNQFYIDGGLFLMNLLYALHYNRIAACPAHWGLGNDSDNKIHKILKSAESEKVICLVPIGLPSKNFKITLSLRRSNSEILKRVF